MESSDQTRQGFNPAEIEVKDDRNTPSVLVDGIHGISFLDGIVSFNFSRVVVPAPQKESGSVPYVEVVQRVCVPASAFARIADFLHDKCESMSKEGLIPTVSESD